MDDDELREVGDSIEEDDKIRLGRLDVELTVTESPSEDNTGALLLFADRPNHPEDGVVTNVMISLGHPSGGENLEVAEYTMEDSPVDDYRFGERLEMNHYKLQHLSVVE